MGTMDETKLLAFDLNELSQDVIEVLLLDGTAELELFRELAEKNTHRPEILKLLHEHPRTPDDVKQFAAIKLNIGLPVSEAPEKDSQPAADGQSGKESQFSAQEQYEFKSQTLFQRLQTMKVGDKIQLALRGSKDIRTILLRDTNKEVQLTVLENPKITISEIELLAKQKTSPDDVIRTIAKKREWVKKYSIVHALVTNPKTPIGIAIKSLMKLQKKDLALIAKNRNIPMSIRLEAKKKLDAKIKA